MSKQHTFLVLSLAILLMVSFAWANEAKEQYLVPATDIAPNAGEVGPIAHNPGIDAQWDLLFWFDIDILVGSVYNVGCEYAGNQFYVTCANSLGGAPTNMVYRFDSAGLLVDSFAQWSTIGGWGWRDIAYDGTLLYAADDNTVDAFTLAGVSVPGSNIVVTPPGGGSFPRAIAYDPATDHFWTGNFGSYLYEFDRTGAVIWSGPPAPIAAVYGMAWDDADPAGPWLWIHDQSPAIPYRSTIYQFDPILHVFTGVSYQMPFVGLMTDNVAGGLAFTDEHTAGFWTLIGVQQGSPADHIFELEMYPSANPSTPAAPSPFTVSDNGATLTATLDWTNPTTMAGGGVLTSIDSVIIKRGGTFLTSFTGVTPGQVMTHNDVTVPSAGLYNYSVHCTNDSGAGPPANAGAWIGLDTPGPVTSLTGAGVGILFEANISWVNPTAGEHGGYWPAGSIDGYTIDRIGPSNATFTPTGLLTTFNDATIPLQGFYRYEVTPNNSSGNGPTVSTAVFYVGPPEFEPIPYNWVEINPTRPGGLPGTNTGITSDDQNVGPFPIGFIFPFYDCEFFSSLRVCSNGFASFTSTMTSYTNYAIPTAAEPNNLLAPYWDDMHPPTYGTVWYYYDAANSRFIVEWDSCAHISTLGEYTFELILYPNGTVDYQYKALTPGTLNSATVGIENSTGTVGIQVTYNGSGPINPTAGMGIRIYPVCVPEEYCIDLTPETVTGSSSAGSSIDYTLTAFNCGDSADTWDGTATVVAGQVWPVELWNAGLTAQIDSIVLASLTSTNFVLRQLIPGGATFGQTSTVEVVLDSRYGTVDNTLSDTSTATTTVAMAGVFDVGGGLMHYPTILAAVADVYLNGIGGPVVFNVFTGTYPGQVNMPAIVGSSPVNTLTIQAAPGQNPVVTSTGHGFYLTGADYVTIRGLEITDVSWSGIYNYYSGSDSSTHNSFIANYIHNVGTAGSYYGINCYRGQDIVIAYNEIEMDYYGLNIYYSDRSLVYNNMVYAPLGTSAYYYGIRLYYGYDNELYYNSVYHGWYYTFYHYYGYNSIVKNNIFYNYSTVSTHRAYQLGGAPTTYGTVSDYNDIYAPNGAAVGYYLAYHYTLAAFQAASGTNANSISADPGYISTTDLHINFLVPSPVDDAGTPIVGITDDIDGDLRDAVTPDIGADEFEFQVLDYCVFLNPPSYSSTGAAGDSTDYYFFVDNCGVLNDAYDITVTVTGEAWPHSIYDYAGTTIIDSLVVNAGVTDSFMVRVSIPGAATMGQTSNGEVVVDSRYGTRNILSDTSNTTTMAAMGGIFDIGGGNNDFPDLISAATAMGSYGLGAACIFEVYTGTYNGQVNLPAITGNNATNTITFRAAPGQNPVVTSTTGHGFYFTGADYVTIRGLEITSCNLNGIYNYYSPDSSNHNSFIGNYFHNVGTGGNYSAIYCYRNQDIVIAYNEIEADYYGLNIYYCDRSLVYNNMVYSPLATSTYYYGIRLYYGYDNELYYNSVYHGWYYTFYHYYGYNSIVKNNIFYNYSTVSTHRAYQLGGAPTTYGTVSDYNDIYAPNGAAVGYYLAYQYTLAAFQLASGTNANSISVDPNFVSYTDTPDLHIVTLVPSPVDGQATPIAGITDDFDGDVRDVATPDIGADEFTLTPLDYCVRLEPTTQTGMGPDSSSVDYMFNVTNCGDSNDVYTTSATVIAGQAWTHEVRDNTGASIITELAVAAGIMDSFIVRCLIPPGIASGQTSTSEVVVYSQNGTDNILTDTSSTVTTGVVPITLPYFENFDITDGGYASGGPSACWGWGVPTFGPGTAYSTPNCWGTVLTGNYQNNACCYLDTPPINLIGPVTMTFYHWYSIENSYDGGNVKISIDGGNTWNLLTPVGGYPGATNTAQTCIPSEPAYTLSGMVWTQAEFDLSAYSGNMAIVRWTFGSDGSVQYPGWYIDDVAISELLPIYNAGTTCIRVTPTTTGVNDGAKKVTGASYDVYATVENAGNQPGNVTVNASDALGWSSSTVITGMAVGCQEVMFPIPWVGGSAGTLNTMTVTTVMVNDTIPGNDTNVKSVTVPGIDGDTLLIDTGPPLVNAWYRTIAGDVIANMFTPTTYPAQINWSSIYLLGLGDPYWPWPDATKDQYALGIWLEDPANPGFPLATPAFNDVCMYSSADGAGWAYVAPDIPVMVNSGSIWIGFENLINCASLGEEGVGLDAALNFAAQNWCRISGVWQQYAPFAGDNMIRANISGGVPPVVDLVIWLVDTDERVSAVLDWSTVAGAAEYKIYKSTTSPTSGFALVDSTTLTQWTDASAVVGTVLSFYYVTADNVLDSPVTAASRITPAVGPVARDQGVSSISRYQQRQLAHPEKANASTLDLQTQQKSNSRSK